MNSAGKLSCIKGATGDTGTWPMFNYNAQRISSYLDLPPTSTTSTVEITTTTTAPLQWLNK